MVGNSPCSFASVSVGAASSSSEGSDARSPSQGRSPPWGGCRTTGRGSSRRRAGRSANWRLPTGRTRVRVPRRVGEPTRTLTTTSRIRPAGQHTTWPGPTGRGRSRPRGGRRVERSCGRSGRREPEPGGAGERLRLVPSGEPAAGMAVRTQVQDAAAEHGDLPAAHGPDARRSAGARPRPPAGSPTTRATVARPSTCPRPWLQTPSGCSTPCRAAARAPCR